MAPPAPPRTHTSSLNPRSLALPPREDLTAQEWATRMHESLWQQQEDPSRWWNDEEDFEVLTLSGPLAGVVVVLRPFFRKLWGFIAQEQDREDL